MKCQLLKGTTLTADWQAEVKPEFVSECLADLDELWKLMIEKSGIPVIETITQGEQTVTFEAVQTKPAAS